MIKAVHAFKDILVLSIVVLALSGAQGLIKAGDDVDMSG